VSRVVDTITNQDSYISDHYSENEFDNGIQSSRMVKGIWWSRYFWHKLSNPFSPARLAPFSKTASIRRFPG